MNSRCSRPSTHPCATSSLVPIAVPLIVCGVVLASCRTDLDEPCAVRSADDAAVAAKDPTCTGIVVSGDGFVDLSSLSGLDHRCDVGVIRVPQLVSVDELPPEVGLLEVRDAPLISEIDVRTIDGVLVSFGVPSMMSLSVELAGGERPLHSVLPQVSSRSDLDFVSVKCLDDCEINLNLINQVGSPVVEVSGNVRIRLSFVSPSFLDLPGLQVIPVDQLVSVYLSDVSDESVEVVEQYVAWLDGEGFEGSVEVLP